MQTETSSRERKWSVYLRYISYLIYFQILKSKYYLVKLFYVNAMKIFKFMVKAAYLLYNNI